VLSELSESVGIVVWPSLAEKPIEAHSLRASSGQPCTGGAVSTSNTCTDKVIGLDEDFSQEELNRAARYLNVEFSGKSLFGNFAPKLLL